MSPSAVLLVSSDRKSREVLPRALMTAAPSLQVDAAGRVSDALARAAQAAYEAIVCCADTKDELSLLIRLKRARPELPVVMLTRVPEAAFDPLAQSFGASAVVRKTSGLPETARALAQALEVGDLARGRNSYIPRSQELARHARWLAKAKRELVELALGLTASLEGRFTALLSEDDSAEQILIARALSRAGLPPFLRTLSTVEESIEYLAGQGPFGDRARNPFPGLVISDLDLRAGSGIDLVRWIRGNPETRHLGFIMLTSSDRDEDLDRAFESGANLYVIKSAKQDEIVGVVKTVYTRFVSEKTGLGPI